MGSLAGGSCERSKSSKRAPLNTRWDHLRAFQGALPSAGKPAGSLSFARAEASKEPASQRLAEAPAPESSGRKLVCKSRAPASKPAREGRLISGLGDVVSRDS